MNKMISFSRSKHDMLVTEILQVYRLTLFPFWFLAATTKPKPKKEKWVFTGPVSLAKVTTKSD